MDVHPGFRLGGYEIVELIGEGGMGAVYLADDTRLGRQVAIKVVRPPFADDPDRMARLTREARLLASLNHQHVATIHDLEESDGVRFLVLELVRGITLAERVAQGALPVREALTLAAQIAAGVEAAHDHGIIHRDLKPANIKITPDGCVKVLDFGLAKAPAPDSGARASSEAPTISSSDTAVGTILGTAAYMSPEQARGKDVDRRTDIWAFGCVLFDMLTGREAFGGDTRSDTIAAILTRDPDWSLLPGDLPASIHRLLRRSLERDVTHRLRDIGDARLEIEEALAPGADFSAGPAGEATFGRIARRHWRPIAAGLIVVAALAAATAWRLKPSVPTAPRPAVQFGVPLPAGERLDSLDFPAIAMSPLETHIAYVSSRGGQHRLFVRALSALEAQPIAGTEGALGPFFSPDGAWIGFFAGGKLKKVQVTGGQPRTICDAAVGFGGTWASDGTIIYAPHNGSEIWQVPDEGGAPRAITKLDTARGEFSHRWPEVLPGADAVLYTVGTEGSWDDAEIVVQSLKSGERHVVVQGGTNPRYLSDGRLLYARGGSVFSVPFDVRTRRTAGAPIQVLTGVFESSDGALQLSASRAGSIAYLAGGASDTARRLVWVDRQGNVQPLAAPERAYASPRLAPDGRTLAVTITGTDRDNVWTYDLERSALSQLTVDGGDSPVWTGDGARLIFSAGRGGPPNLFWTQADGSGMDERLARDERADVPNSASADGRTVAFVGYTPSSGRDVFLFDISGRAVRPLLDSPANETAPAISPDGQWIAYVSDESGQDEVYLASIRDPKRQVKVSAAGGSEPVWRRDGAELFFRSGARMMAASVTTRPAASVKPAHALFEAAFDTGAASRPAYDVSADGARFLMVARNESEQGPRDLRVILAWPEGSRARQ